MPAEILKTLREKKAKELAEQLGLEKLEVGKARQLIKDWEVKPDEPSVVAAGILEKFANETKVTMENVGARAGLVPATEGDSDEGETETDTGEPPADEVSESPAGPEPSPESSIDVLAQIEKLGQLHDTGVLTDEEFQAKKAELLQRV